MPRPPGPGFGPRPALKSPAHRTAIPAQLTHPCQPPKSRPIRRISYVSDTQCKLRRVTGEWRLLAADRRFFTGGGRAERKVGGMHIVLFCVSHYCPREGRGPADAGGDLAAGRWRERVRRASFDPEPPAWWRGVRRHRWIRMSARNRRKAARSAPVPDGIGMRTRRLPGMNGDCRFDRKTLAAHAGQPGRCSADRDRLVGCWGSRALMCGGGLHGRLGVGRNAVRCYCSMSHHDDAVGPGDEVSVAVLEAGGHEPGPLVSSLVARPARGKGGAVAVVLGGESAGR
jgi:hypothetical protein